MEEKFEYGPIIEQILHRYEKKERDVKKLLTFMKWNDTEYKIPYDIFVYELYQSITSRSVATEQKTRIINGLDRELYKEVMSQQSQISIKRECAANLKIVLDQKRIYYKNRFTDWETGSVNASATVLQNRHQILQTPFSDFSDYLVSLVNDCIFATINITVQSVRKNYFHSNLIFLEKVNLGEGDEFILLNYYEPHGRKYIPKSIKELLSRLQESSNGVIIPNTNLSPEKGLQGLLKGKEEGYCVMFSLFWIYVVLNIVVYNLNNDIYLPSQAWIDKVESYIIAFYNQPGRSMNEFYNVIIEFGSELFNNYILSYPEERDEIWQIVGENLEHRPEVVKENRVEREEEEAGEI